MITHRMINISWFYVAGNEGDLKYKYSGAIRYKATSQYDDAQVLVPYKVKNRSC